MLTKKIEYAYIILRKISTDSRGRLMSGKQILESTNIPYNMGLGILTELSNAGLISSLKGKNGGFYMKKNEITLLDLYFTLEYSHNILNRHQYIDHEFREIALELRSRLLKELKSFKIISSE